MTTWNIEKIYATTEEINRDIQLIEKGLKDLKILKENPYNHLAEILEVIENLYRLSGKLLSFHSMRKDENSKISENQKEYLKIKNMVAKVHTETSFFEPFMYSLSSQGWDEVYNRNDLVKYHSYFRKLQRYQDHYLSEKEESILSQFGEISQNSYNAFYNLSYADLVFPKLKSTTLELNHSNYSKLLMNENQEVRKESFEKMYESYESLKNTFGSTLYGNMKYQQILSKVRKYTSVRDMALYSDNVTIEMYDGLIEAVHHHLSSYQKFYDLRREKLGLSEMNMYDVYLPVTKYEEEIPYTKAQEIIISALEPLGKEYIEIVKRALSEKWIDVYPRDGKRAGAYSGGSYDTDPYILLNYNGTIESVFTLAHELGHSVHSYYSRKNNNYYDASYSIFVAEVASTFNELLVLDYLKNKAKKKEEKLFFLDYHLNAFKSTVFRQTMFAEFEKEIYQEVEKGLGLTGDDYSKIYYDLNNKYFGDFVYSNSEIQLEWARVPHFYYNFYVYKYATGFCAATLLSKKVLEGRDKSLERYMEFLKDGSKNLPLEQLRKAGCDIADPEVLEEALSVFDHLINEYEEYLK